MYRQSIFEQVAGLPGGRYAPRHYYKQLLQTREVSTNYSPALLSNSQRKSP
jgi:hypothetical protein